MAKSEPEPKFFHLLITYLPTYLCIYLPIYPFIQSVIHHPPYSTIYPFLHPSTCTIHSAIFPPIILPPSTVITGAVTSCLSEHELFRKLASSAGPLFLTNSQFLQF